MNIVEQEKIRRVLVTCGLVMLILYMLFLFMKSREKPKEVIKKVPITLCVTQTPTPFPTIIPNFNRGISPQTGFGGNQAIPLQQGSQQQQTAPPPASSQQQNVNVENPPQTQPTPEQCQLIEVLGLCL